MNIKHLNNSFYQRNSNFQQILKPKNGRGYGIVPIKIHGYIFGIPLHSNINHKSGFILGNKSGKNTGLDYNKAVILENGDIGRTFKIPPKQLSDIKKNQKIIIDEFSKFLFEFIYRAKINDYNVLNRTYKYSTLVYYRKELTKFTAILGNPLQTITTEA